MEYYYRPASTPTCRISAIRRAQASYLVESHGRNGAIVLVYMVTTIGGKGGLIAKRGNEFFYIQNQERMELIDLAGNPR